MTDIAHNEKILVLDFGSQYTQLIARRVRELNVYCEILPCTVHHTEIEAFNPKGIILSGGPSSVYDDEAPTIDPDLFEMGVPVLGICYGMQLTTHLLGGRVERTGTREYGPATIRVGDMEDLFEGFHEMDEEELPVWMSHGDRVEEIPPGFHVVAESNNSPFAAIRNEERTIFGLQFHPEVVHTPQGTEMLANFVHKICGCGDNWTMANFIDSSIEAMREQIGDKRVILGLSGGVDSTVTAMLLHKAVGTQLTSIFVNNGLLRKNEAEQVLSDYKNKLNLNVVYVNASDRFLGELAGVEDPEEKRKIIGRVFIDVFIEEAKKIEDAHFLAQGTLYPDVIESVSFKGPSATIKSHHNVGGLPAYLKL
ncbi:MAG: glutamine-hydrolyzing GMP synthase, partial [Myxococcales bacterium]|nr:glutamine-hydrolyzing GMP synthase [Myxococcales bacterium]